MDKTELTIRASHGHISEGETILEAMRRDKTDLYIESACNGKKICGKCKIIVTEGSLSTVSTSEKKFLTKKELEQGVRLACFARAIPPLRPVTVELIRNSNGACPVLHAGYLPDMNSQATINANRHNFIHDPVAKKEFSARKETLVRFRGEWIGTEFGNTTDHCYGIAADIGATTVACSLLDLSDGKTLASASALNPQIKFGGDVLSRIEYTTRTTDGLSWLQSLIVSCLDGLTDEMIKKADVHPQYIYAYAIAANTTMLHILLGVNPASIATAPFAPIFTGVKTLATHEIGLKNCAAFARLSCLPSVSAYIGADVVAGIVACGMDSADGNIMYIDIGTNGEIILLAHGRISACSCAAGPALEGMNISCGMPAFTGAIEHVSYKNGVFAASTIENAAATGICGSGVLEALVALIQSGAVDSGGRMLDPPPPGPAPFLVRDGKMLAYRLSTGEKPIFFTQGDVRQAQLAKGAILSGVLALLNDRRLDSDMLDRILVAGQFGAHLKEDILIRAGILPEAFRGKIIYTGNSSLSGASLSLLDSDALRRMNALAGRIEYMELADYPDYTNLFMNCMQFPSPD